jgi:hypothetical protein
MTDVPVRIVDASSEHPGRLRDICRDAALVEAPMSWPIGAELSLKMALPGINDLVEVKGRVIRVAAADTGDHGFAVLFTDVTPVAGMRIDFFVAMQTEPGGPGRHP